MVKSVVLYPDGVKTEIHPDVSWTASHTESGNIWSIGTRLSRCMKYTGNFVTVEILGVVIVGKVFMYVKNPRCARKTPNLNSKLCREAWKKSEGAWEIIHRFGETCQCGHLGVKVERPWLDEVLQVVESGKVVRCEFVSLGREVYKGYKEWKKVK